MDRIDRIRNDECGMMSDELKASCLSFITHHCRIHHLSFILCILSIPVNFSLAVADPRG
jgi:hypothetical protein